MGALRSLLESLSTGGKRWWLEDPLEVRPAVRSEYPSGAVAVFCCDPAVDRVTDEISFLIPVMALPSPGAVEETTLVCLHPDVIRPQIEGLYLENGQVLTDFLEDWSRFWEPLRTALEVRIDLARGSLPLGEE